MRSSVPAPRFIHVAERKCHRHDFGIYAAVGGGYALPRMSPFLDHVDDYESRQFAAGALVIEQGQETGELLVLVSGTVEILRDDVRVAKAAEPGVVRFSTH